MTKALAEKRWLDVVYLDFAKAFDTIAYKRLLLKLQAYGVSGKLHNWLRAFLSGRTQRVVLGDVGSAGALVPSGVPQGSVLGPLLFVLFINDLAEVANRSKLYADDSKILADVGPSSSQEASSPQDDLTRVKQSTDLWLSKLILFKYEVLHIGTNNPRKKYFIGDQQLNCQDVQRGI